MADKAFTIQKYCEARKASLNIPPFLSQNKQFTPSEVAETQEIASLCIHVERAIQRAKNNNLFKMIIPLSMVGLFDFIECFMTTFLRAHSWLNWVKLSMVGTVSQLWVSSVLLTKFQGPLIIDKTDYFIGKCLI